MSYWGMKEIENILQMAFLKKISLNIFLSFLKAQLMISNQWFSNRPEAKKAEVLAW